MMTARIAIRFLLALLHGVDDTESFVARAINVWPSELCDAPANHEELLGHVENIWQEWVGDDATPGPEPHPGPGPGPGPELDSGTVPSSARGAGYVSTPSPAKEHSAGSSLTNPTIIIIDDDDDEVENAETLIMLRELSVSAPAPDVGSATSPTNEKSGRTSPTNSVIIIDDDDTHDTPNGGRVCSPTANNNAVAFPSPESMRKQVAVKDAKARSTKAKSARSQGKKKVVDNDNNSKRDQMLINPFSLGSTRKRRPEIDHSHVPEYEKGFPELNTPSKRQKTKN